MGATVAAVIAAKERAIVEAFRDAGATALVTAVPLEQLGVEENVGFRRLRRHEVIREAVPGRYYLDEDVWTAVRRTRLRLVMVLLGIVLGIALCTFLTTTLGVAWLSR